MESFNEKISRVKLMASGSGTWDLSDNDLAALNEVLSQLQMANDLIAHNRAALATAEARLAESEALVAWLRAQCDQAELAIQSCAALKDWAPSTVDQLGSRVTFLCNIYQGAVRTIQLFHDKADSLQSRLLAAEAQSEARRVALENLWNECCSDEPDYNEGIPTCSPSAKTHDAAAKVLQLTTTPSAAALSLIAAARKRGGV